MASRVLPSIRPGRSSSLLLLPPLCRGPAPGRPSPARPRVRSSPLPAAPAAWSLPAPARAPGARAFSRAGPACGASREVPPLPDAEAGFKERRRIDKRKIIISWLPPSRPVKLQFKDIATARAAQELYKSRGVTVLGQPVAAVRPWHRIRPVGWTVTLLSVPDAATPEDIVRGLDPETRPHYVDVKEHMPQSDVDAAVRRLKKKVEAYGPLLRWQYPLQAPRRVRIAAVFKDPASAEEAVKALHRDRIKFKNGTEAVMLVNAHTAIQLRVPARHYEVTQALIREAVARWKQERIAFLENSVKDDHVLFKITGEDGLDETLLDAARAVEAILDGHLVVSEDNKPLWHAGLDPMLAKVNALQDELPVYIVRSRENDELRVSGPLPECREAMKRIAAMINEYEASPSPDGDAPSQ